LSGWCLEDGKGDAIPFTLDIVGDASITQVAVHVAAEVAGITKPRDVVELYMVVDGKETLIPTKLIQTSIFKNSGTYENGNPYPTYVANGYRYILEIANEGLYVPDDAKLKLRLGRTSDNNESNAYIFAGIQILGRKGNVYAQSEVVNDQA
jgi:hypothetical protein